MTTRSPPQKNTHPEKQKPKEKQRQLMLPKARQILTPELPFELHKRASVRSHLTAITQDSQSTAASDVHSDVLARKLIEAEDDENDDYIAVTRGGAEDVVSTFFIPGITGKARCLEKSEKVNDTETSSFEHGREKDSIAASSRSSTKRSEKSSRSRTSAGDSRRSSGESYEKNSRSDSSLDHAEQLYSAVVESIQARRDEGLNDLGEEEYQRMMSLLHPEEPEPSLRQQVTSIRRILSDFERKEMLKQRKSKKG